MRKNNEELPCDEVGNMLQRLKVTGSPLYSDGHRIMYDFPLCHWSKEARILEVGVGYGYGLQKLSGIAREIVAIDTDNKCIDFAITNYDFKNVKYLEADIRTLDNIGLFDVVVAIDVIEHINNPIKAVANMKKLLKSGGVLFISTPFPKLYAEGNPVNPHHIREYFPDEFMDLIKSEFDDAIIYNKKNDNILIIAQKEIPFNSSINNTILSRKNHEYIVDCALSEYEIIINSEEAKKISKIVGNRNVAILAHGGSVGELENHSNIISALDVCFCSLNNFTILEDSLLIKSGKDLSIVYCSSEDEILRRKNEIYEFLQRDNVILISTAEAINLIPDVKTKYMTKICLVSVPRLTEKLMPNSISVLIQALLKSNIESKCIALFGVDGLLDNRISALDTYFKKEIISKESRSYNLINDTILFNFIFKATYERIVDRNNKVPIVVNCSEKSYIKAFPIVKQIHGLVMLNDNANSLNLVKRNEFYIDIKNEPNIYKDYEIIKHNNLLILCNSEVANNEFKNYSLAELISMGKIVVGISSIYDGFKVIDILSQ